MLSNLGGLFTFSENTKTLWTQLTHSQMHSFGCLCSSLLKMSRSKGSLVNRYVLLFQGCIRKNVLRHWPPPPPPARPWGGLASILMKFFWSNNRATARPRTTSEDSGGGGPVSVKHPRRTLSKLKSKCWRHPWSWILNNKMKAEAASTTTTTTTSMFWSSRASFWRLLKRFC